MVKAAVVRHMPSVEDYRARLAGLQGSWDTLSLLSHLRGDGTDVSSTRQAFEALANDLILSLSEETYKKALLALKAKGQTAIDVLVRNLFERTADIGFLTTDDSIREYLRQRRTDGANIETLNDRLRRRFREYVGKYSVYHDVVLLDNDGEVLVRLDEQHQVARTSHSLLRQTLATKQSYVETFGRVDLVPSATRSLIYSFRVGEGSRTEGVLCLCFRFEDEVDGIFAKLRAAEDWTTLCLLDRQGTVIASSDPWQAPIGAPLPIVLEEGGRVIRFAGREYLAITRRTQGYQGYLGPGWYGHAMLPVEHAFDHADDERKAIPHDLLTALRQSATIFSPALRKIPIQADCIQRDLNRTVWNGNVQLASSTDSGSDFTKVLLREIGNAGRRTQETFERSISELQQTVVSSILDDAQLLASLAVDVLDRNLYERANDCRWWALNGALSRQLCGHSVDGEGASAILRHINSLYTVYYDIVLFDAAGHIVAVSNASHADKVGRILNEPWAAATLELRDSQQFAVSSFTPCELYDGRHTLVYGAAIRNESRRVVGGIGIVFDSAPQVKAILRDALPRTESGDVASGCIGLFVDSCLNVVAATDRFQPGDMIDLPRDLLGAHASAPQTICIDGVHYAIGVRKCSGYREYTGMGVFGLILIPLGAALEQSLVRRAEAQNHRRGNSHEAVVDVATFYCGQQRLGLMRNEIVEALDGANIRPIPGAPAWHAGLLMYRELPLPVIDLSQLLNVGQGTHARNVIVVRAADTGQLFGLLVEELADIPEIDVSRILPVAELNTRGPAILDRAVRPERPEEPMLMIINIAQLLICARAAGLRLTPPPATVTKLRATG